MANGPTERTCQCQGAEHLAAEPDSPIAFDARLNEYHLVRGRWYSIMFYCFRCGGRLPESTRDELFFKPDAAEQAEATSLLATAKSRADIFRLLGPADEVFSRNDLSIDHVHPNA